VKRLLERLVQFWREITPNVGYIVHDNPQVVRIINGRWDPLRPTVIVEKPR
jgi:hypothetical protein